MKVKLYKSSFDETIQKVEDLFSNRDIPQVVSGQASSSRHWEQFRQQTNPAPCVLENDSDHLEVMKFTQCLIKYIQTGFRGPHPESNIYIYISPFISATWRASLENRNVRAKNLEAIIADILDKISIRYPIHGRRMDLLRLKRNTASHSDFLIKLDEILELVEYEKINGQHF